MNGPKDTMTKQELRKQIKEILKSSSNTFLSQSKNISQHILQLPEFTSSSYIFSYMALSDEVELSLVTEEALKLGKTVTVPKITPGTNLMEFYKMDDSLKMENGSYGIQEPGEAAELIDCDRLEGEVLVLVPGRAFTKDGTRLGRGKGFYDIYLNRLCENKKIKLHTIGVCFSQQIVDELPMEEHDIKMQKVVWE